MLFVWMGFFKEGAGPIPARVQEQATGFLQQPYIKIRSVGRLTGAGEKDGMMMVFEVADRTAAEALVKNSPYLNAGLYEDHRLYEYADEIG